VHRSASSGVGQVLPGQMEAGERWCHRCFKREFRSTFSAAQFKRGRNACCKGCLKAHPPGSFMGTSDADLLKMDRELLSYGMQHDLVDIQLLSQVRTLEEIFTSDKYIAVRWYTRLACARKDARARVRLRGAPVLFAPSRQLALLLVLAVSVLTQQSSHMPKDLGCIESGSTGVKV